MTRLEKIKAFIKALSVHLNIRFVRSEQTLDRPDYPFMSYKILSSEPEPAQCIIDEYEPVTGNDTVLQKTSTRESDLIVSLSFIGGEKDYPALWAFAEEAHDWIDSLPGIEAADGIGIGVSVQSPVQDRTVYLETEYEHKFGFDFKVRDRKSKIEAVDAVDLAATFADITEI